MRLVQVSGVLAHLQKKGTPMRKALSILVLTALLGLTLPSSIAFAQAVGTGTYDDANTAIQYSGTWSTVSGGTYANAMSGTLHFTQDPNATASLTFIGSSITVWYTAAYNRGIMQILLNGTSIDVFNTNLPEIRRQVGKTYYTTSSTTPQIITVRPYGGCVCTIDVDAFSVNIASNGVGTYDDFGTLVSSRFFGSWTSSTSTSGAFQSTLHWSDTPGSLVRFTFFGEQIQVVFSRGPNRGRALVTIDGKDKGTIDQYSSDSAYPRQYTRTYKNLGSGIHVINIVVSSNKHSSSTGTRVDLDAFDVPACPGDVKSCRAYARVHKEYDNTYSAVASNIDFADPLLRNTTNESFSSGVLWIGDFKFKNIGSYFEAGWHKEMGGNNNASVLYYGYYVSGSKFQPTVFAYAYDTRYKIQAYQQAGPPGCYWRMYTDAVERTGPLGADLGICAGNIRAGGEVTDTSISIHNEMGVSFFSSLTYGRNLSAPTTSWNGWDFQTEDYNYGIDRVDGNSFYIKGYNGSLP